MTSKHHSHAESAHSAEKKSLTVSPKLHVQRSLSKENITIHFSALGKEEEEEEEELYMTSVSATSATQDNSNIVTALEASEEMFDAVAPDSEAEVSAIPESSRPSLVSKRHTNTSPTHTPSSSSSASSSSSHVSEKKGATSNSSPTKSLSFPSSDKPFLNLVKSLSSDMETREGIPPVATPTVRHRHLMKNFVKSLSSDTSQDTSTSSSTPYRLPESRLNLQLFKQFTQSRASSGATSSASDSKTAPSSPLTSQDNRSFFKVSEVEAKIEDTKRRLSEAISEPLQLLSKIMDEKSVSLGSSSIYRPKALSANATELSNISSVNGHLESNNNYCIKEEEGGDWEAESPNSDASGPADASSSSTCVDTKCPNKSSALSMSLDKCSMSALAKQEDEEYCILYNGDFETCNETDSNSLNRTDETGSQTKVPLSGSTEPCSEDESESIEPAPSVPHYTLILLTVLVYGCFVLPLPSYIGGVLLGIGLGFFLAIGVVWLTGPKPSGRSFRHSRQYGKLWNLAKMDIKEPEIYKGWMNEILNYDPETYHATLTQSVFVRLEGSIIRLSKPNHNIARRATHNEPKPDVNYISQKIYDLTNSKVYLMPPSLARKRLWNKKYPVCIELGKQDDFMSKAEGEKWEPSESPNTKERGEVTGITQDRRSSSSRDLTLYLFGRTGREKEEWFQRFLSASKLKVDLKKAVSMVTCKSVPTALSSHSRSGSRSSLDELATQPRSKDSSASSTTAGSAKTKPLLEYSVYMASILPKQAAVSPAAASPAPLSPQNSPGSDKKLQTTTSTPVQLSVEEDDNVAWVNAALGRVFWDFLSEPHWAELVSNKIQMKLSKIRLPYFMNELTLTELDMGSATPRIMGASKPSIDYRGLWFDLELSYSGSFLMTLETKMNLIRLGKEGESVRLGEFGKDGYRPRTYCLADSDEESSSAGSSDEEDLSELSNDSAGAEGFIGGHKSSKIMRFVDKITKSKYFQKATETEFIKKKMEEVSNTPLLLTVELQELQGTLAVNIPPPPTDRIWYGFRRPPHLELKARPKLGEREVTLAHVTDWIEKKLDQEFQKIFVMPNMDDVWLTIMHSAMDPRTAGGPFVGPAVDPGSSPPEKDSTSQP
ncbi:testis-expressed protein 2-like [Notolabrus celidotus]|uniref:testis-expressed protein 2-like n=1 Tax=Notolabrus celidotus TaxID=1203425 RepID=UPI00148FE99D|nr:testis-expressed protein 2-like [Notolabrus celidotus]XP_034543806.1 testis-expressed protein 2-like [Notolabrus celidotus]